MSRDRLNSSRIEVYSILADDTLSISINIADKHVRWKKSC